MRQTIKIAVLCCSIALVFEASSLAQNYTNIYSRSALQRAYQTYSSNLQAVWELDLKAKLAANEKLAAADVNMRLPDIGQHRHPLDFYGDAGARRITIPIMSVKFFDDICIALAWMERRGCDKMWVSDYAGMLGYQGNKNFSGSRYPDPLSVFGVPQNVLDDDFVNDVSGKALKSGIYFLMAHELAHVLYAHQSYDRISRQQAQRQEIQADNFALNLMREISVPPVGISFFFMIASRFERAPADFNSRSKYDAYIRDQATHPLTSTRLINVADYIRDNVRDFAAGQNQPAQWYPRILSIAENIRQIGLTLDHPNIKDLQRQRSQQVTVNELINACR